MQFFLKYAKIVSLLASKNTKFIVNNYKTKIIYDKTISIKKRKYS